MSEILSVVERAVAELLNDLLRFVHDDDAFELGEGNGCLCTGIVLWTTFELRPGECIECDESLFFSRQYMGDVGD